MTQTQAQIIVILISIYVAASVFIAAMAAIKNLPYRLRRRRQHDENHLEEIRNLLENINSFISNKHKPFPDAQDYADYEKKINDLEHDNQRGDILYNQLQEEMRKAKTSDEVMHKALLALKTDKDKLESENMHLRDRIITIQIEKLEYENSQARIIQELQIERQANDELRAYIQELNKKE